MNRSDKRRAKRLAYSMAASILHANTDMLGDLPSEFEEAGLKVTAKEIHEMFDDIAAMLRVRSVESK